MFRDSGLRIGIRGQGLVFEALWFRGRGFRVSTHRGQPRTEVQLTVPR